jgi:hypothetical protein
MNGVEYNERGISQTDPNTCEMCQEMKDVKFAPNIQALLREVVWGNCGKFVSCAARLKRRGNLKIRSRLCLQQRNTHFYHWTGFCGSRQPPGGGLWQRGAAHNITGN